MTTLRFPGVLSLVMTALDTDHLRAESNHTLALVGARVIGGTGAPPLPDAVVIIESGRIRRVAPRSEVVIPEGVDRRDLTGLTLLPGLIDSHVRINFALPRGPADPKADATINQALMDLLRYGVTSIRDLGAGYPWIIDFAHSIEGGRRKGPRIFAASPLLTAPGGHPAATLLRGNAAAIAAGTRQIVSPEEGRAAVRDLARGGVEVIKAIFDSGGRANRPQRIPTLDPEVLRAIVHEGRTAGVPVTVHWGNAEELPPIIAARPTQLEHAGYAPIPLGAIQAATSRPARLVKRGQEIGTIQEGKRADLIAVEGGLLQAISDTRKIRLVIQDGRPVEAAGRANATSGVKEEDQP